MKNRPLIFQRKRKKIMSSNIWFCAEKQRKAENLHIWKAGTRGLFTDTIGRLSKSLLVILINLLIISAPNKFQTNI